MSTENIFLILILSVCAIAVAVFYKRSQNPIKSAFIGAITGILSLGIGNFIAINTGFTLNISGFTCAVSAILGLPAVVAMAIMNFMFGL